jgi:hypothetical protein
MALHGEADECTRALLADHERGQLGASPGIGDMAIEPRSCRTSFTRFRT